MGILFRNVIPRSISKGQSKQNRKVAKSIQKYLIKLANTKFTWLFNPAGCSEKPYKMFHKKVRSKVLSTLHFPL